MLLWHYLACVYLFFILNVLELHALCTADFFPFEATHVINQELSTHSLVNFSGYLSCSPEEKLQLQFGLDSKVFMVNGSAAINFEWLVPAATFGTRVGHTSLLPSDNRKQELVLGPAFLHEVLPRDSSVANVTAEYAQTKSFGRSPGKRASCSTFRPQTALFFGVPGDFEYATELFRMFGVTSHSLVDSTPNCTASGQVHQCFFSTSVLPGAEVAILGNIPNEIQERVYESVSALRERGAVILGAGANLYNMQAHGFITQSWPEWRLRIRENSQPWLLAHPIILPKFLSVARAHALSLLVPVAFPANAVIALSVALLQETIRSVKSMAFNITLRVFFVAVGVDDVRPAEAFQLLHVLAEAIRSEGAETQSLAHVAAIPWDLIDIVIDTILLPFVSDDVVLRALSLGKPVISAGFGVEAFMAKSAIKASGVQNILCIPARYTSQEVISCLQSFLFIEHQGQDLGHLGQNSFGEPSATDLHEAAQVWLSGTHCMAKKLQEPVPEQALYRFQGKLLNSRDFLLTNLAAMRMRGNPPGPGTGDETETRQMQSLLQARKAYQLDMLLVRQAVLRGSDPLADVQQLLQTHPQLRGISAEIALSHVVSCFETLKHSADFLAHILSKRPQLRPFLLPVLHSRQRELQRMSSSGGSDFQRFCAVASVEHMRDSSGLIAVPLYRDVPSSWDKPVLNPALDFEAIEADYDSNAPGLTYFDNFLTQESMKELLRFSQDNDMYFEEKKGYVGAYPWHGFVHPALLRLVDELRAAMPNLLKDYAVENMWSYKATHNARSAVGIHADDADLNFNFWVTDSSANLVPDSGGLVVYQTTRPVEWSFHNYNHGSHSAAMRAFVLDANATKIRVPFRQGRCVLFNSSLFHESDEHWFRPGYRTQRINFTILFSKVSRMEQRGQKKI